jgi:hypothetical protein
MAFFALSSYADGTMDLFARYRLIWLSNRQDILYSKGEVVGLSDVQEEGLAYCFSLTCKAVGPSPHKLQTAVNNSTPSVTRVTALGSVSVKAQCKMHIRSRRHVTSRLLTGEEQCRIRKHLYNVYKLNVLFLQTKIIVSTLKYLNFPLIIFTVSGKFCNTISMYIHLFSMLSFRLVY